MAALGTGFAALMAACTPSGTAPASSSASALTKVKGGHIVEAGFGQLLTQPLNGSTSGINGLYSNGLLWVKGNGDIEPRIAESMPTVSPDGLTYTFKIRPNITWSDGEPINADDVMWTFQTFLQQPGYEIVRHDWRTHVRTYMQKVEKVDSLTVAFTLKKPWAPWAPIVMTRSLFPAHMYQGKSAESLRSFMPSVVAGPFVPVSLGSGGQEMTLKRNDKFPLGPVALEQYVYRTYASVDAVVAAFQSGEVDFSVGVLGSQHAAPLKSAGMSVWGHYDSNPLCMSFNMDPAKPASRFFPQADPRVRQALMYALDREAMATAIFRGFAQPARSFIPSYSWAYNKDTKPQYTFDPAKAASLLDAAGWKLNASGQRERDGVPLKFDFKEIAGDAVEDSVSASLQEQWRKVGVNVTITGYSSAERLDQWTSKRSYDTMLMTTASPPDPDYSIHLHSAFTAPGSFNSALYKSPEADRLLEAGAATLDQAQRKTFYFQLQDLLANDLPIAALFDRQHIYGMNTRVQGVMENTGSMGSSYSRDYMKDAWVKDGK
jgi:peptide/nickel transport system substrate-binding protein